MNMDFRPSQPHLASLVGALVLTALCLCTSEPTEAIEPGNAVDSRSGWHRSIELTSEKTLYFVGRGKALYFKRPVCHQGRTPALLATLASFGEKDSGDGLPEMIDIRYDDRNGRWAVSINKWPGHNGVEKWPVRVEVGCRG